MGARRGDAKGTAAPGETGRRDEAAPGAGGSAGDAGARAPEVRGGRAGGVGRVPAKKVADKIVRDAVERIRRRGRRRT